MKTAMRSTAALFFILVASAVACGDLVQDPPIGGAAPQNDSGAPQGDDDGSAAVGDDASTGADTASGGDDATAPSPDATGDDASTVTPPDASIPPGAVIGSCDPRLWSVSASDSHPVSPAAYAVDGLPPTRWSSGLPQAAGQYFQVDFGGYVVLNQIAMDDSFGPADHADYPRGFSVLGSTDGATYSTTLTTQNISTDPGAVVTTSFAAQATRSIRIQLTTSSTSWWSMHELRLGCSTPPGSATPDAGPPTDYDAGNVTGPGLPHTGWTATASSVGNTDVAANAIDGNTSTRWSSGKAQYGDEWIRVDLGQATSIRQVWLTSNATDFSAAYALDVSTDDVNYTTVISGLGATLTKIPFAPRSARYVRIRQIGSDDTSWWSVYEINVIP